MNNARTKGTNARWTLTFAKGQPRLAGKPGVAIVNPSVGCKSSLAVCRRYGSVRRGMVISAACFDGRMLRDVVINDDQASDVWAGSLKASTARSALAKRRRMTSRIAADPTTRGLAQ
ncbi:hypothetical protein [Sphingomonas sp. BAUL-RG-20F-R05-02]|uniref:hypothetical protein n=1 Tax=Sphingomonas sp. BAUL-RG-20F-R05-02 TaxID=2914830 RepID=UPI001F59733F|nr:hypothetical protein [Sphingomonas sp. BAUL-RG-20F-R05-02]